MSVVHPDDLESYLKSINKYKEIKRGLVKCEVCHGTITIDNVGKIRSKRIKEEDPIYRIRCDKFQCITRKYTEESAQKRIGEIEERIEELDSYPDRVKTEELGEMIDNPYVWEQKESIYAERGDNEYVEQGN